MSKPQHVSNILAAATEKLAAAGIATARLDVLVLLEDETEKDRAWLLAHPEFELGPEAVTNLESNINRRELHVPLAYIRGTAEFYGREFIVNEHTLVPRPETETIIDMVKHVSRLESSITGWEDSGRKRSGHRRDRQGKLAETSSLVHSDEGYKLVWEKAGKQRQKKGTLGAKPKRLNSNDNNLCLIDIGTGSGAIAITVKLELPETTVFATDIDEKCLQTARRNAETLAADISFLRGNLLEPTLPLPPSQSTILLCNLPYVPDNFQINTAATHEPRHALFGGPDGLDLYRELFDQIVQTEDKPLYILCESLPPQHEVLTGIAKAAGYLLGETSDFIQLFTLGLESRLA